MKPFLVKFLISALFAPLLISCALQKNASNVTLLVNGDTPDYAGNPHFEMRDKQIAELLSNNEYDQARQIISTALQSYPDDVSLHYHLGLSYMRQKLYGEAILQFEKVLEFDESHKPALFNLASIKQQKKNLDEARRLYEKLLIIDPNDPDTHYNIALVYDRLFKLEKALYHYQKCFPLFKQDRTKRPYIKAIKKRMEELEFLIRKDKK